MKLEDTVLQLCNKESEQEWFEFKENWYEPVQIGEYVSALSNAAAYHFEDKAYIIWGVNDKTHEIVGRDFERKGGFLLLEAFKIIKDKFKLPLKLYIAGCEKKETIEDVFWLGDLPVSKLKHYFEISDIFVLPSYFEAYGLVFIEALTYGLPCIARNDFEMKNFIQDGYNGYLIDNDDPSLLADKILDLIKNDRIKQNVFKERNKYLEEYSWDSVAKRIVGVLNKEFCIKK